MKDNNKNLIENENVVPFFVVFRKGLSDLMMSGTTPFFSFLQCRDV